MLRFSRWMLLFGFTYAFALHAESAGQRQQDLTSAVQSQALSPATATSANQPNPSPSSDSPVQSAPPNPLGDAKELARKGDFDGAIEKYQQFLKDTPKSPDAYAGLTRVYLKKRDVEQAYETVNKALLVADSWPVHVALGEVYFRQGRIPEAEKEWIGVIKAGYPAPRAYLGLARVRWALSMNKSAKALIDKAYELDPRDPDIQRSWVRTLPRSERIKHYETYSAESNDSEERDFLVSYLSYLKERAKQQDRPCRLATKVKATTAALVRLLIDAKHVRGYGLSVVLNGSKTTLMLDTGASGILVKRSIAERAGITKLAETKVWGVGDKGPKNAYIGTANSIRIGELEFQDCPVEVMESRSVAGEDGLIGADVFAAFLVEIDFPGEQLKLSELPKRPGQGDSQLALKNEDDDFDDLGAAGRPETAGDTGASKTPSSGRSPGPQDSYIAKEMQSFSRVYRFGHQLLIPTKIGDAPYKLFLLDTGAWTNSISPQAAREVTKIRGDDTIVKGISGSVKDVYSANHAVLQFGRLRQENQDMLSFDTSSISESNGTEISGFLGFTLLRLLDIKIDYRDGLVDFTYDPNRLHHVNRLIP